MSYAACETAVVTILRLLTSTFATADVGTDYSVLDNGSNNRAVVLPGGMGDNGVGAHMTNRTWDLLIDINIRYTDKTTFTKFAALRDTVISHLDKYPTLNRVSGVVVLTIIADGDPYVIKDKADRGPIDVGQILRMTVSDNQPITGGEY